MSNAWSIAIDTICGALETEPRGTFLVKPGEVAKLPPDVAAIEGRKLRDKPSPGVDKGPVNKAAFFTHLARKAHFFMLPKPIVKFVKESSMVSISEQLPELPKEDPPKPPGEETPDLRKADAVLHKDGTVTINVPGATDALSIVGQGLGGDFDPDEYKVLDLSYHEMTHAWLWLRASSDSDVQALYTQGVTAYANAQDWNNQELNAEKAFSEAAAYYVQDRIFRWCRAVGDLAYVLEAPKERSWKLTKPLQTVDEYDAPLEAFGKVGGKEIKSPRLTDPECLALRAAIDSKILAGRPLTKQRFMDVPQLAALRKAALEKATK